ncbi:MAG TPA: dephospho-CoA kinase, partial [Ktedonobacteraceae bacterium]|nr:dephospho-CoA kinase [Ktedonobacteraceae bacterium]
MVRILGITGNIACGKTAVGHMLLDLGVEKYIDADALVHQLYLSGQPIARRVAEVFDEGVMAQDGSVDRQKLGALVFQDAAALRRLEEIVHPAVGQAMLRVLAEVSSGGVAVIDAVKLLEGGSGALCQSKWLITCPEEQEMARLMARNGLSADEARARLQAQPSVERRLPLVDEVIDNGGTLEQTRRQVEAAFQRFQERFP